MQILSEAEILTKIERQETFHAQLAEAGLTINIDQYVPCVCTAIHNGHQLRRGLAAKCLLTENERLNEEGPFTGELISSSPITLIVEDSQFEFDLNHPPEQIGSLSVRDKPVWEIPLTASEIAISQKKHRHYYQILHALLKQLENKFDACVVYDFQICKTIEEESIGTVPVFKVASSQENAVRWINEVSHFISQLNKIQLLNIEVRAVKDELIQHPGYQAAYIHQHFEKTLVLSTEIKKVYFDESSGDAFPLVMTELKEGLKYAIALNASYFARKQTRCRNLKKNDLLPGSLEKVVRKIDHQLFHIGKGIETLLYINPVNLQQEKKRFFSKKFNYSPSFKYRQLDIGPYLFKESLYRIPVDLIQDISIQSLYRKVIDAYAAKIDLITSIGTDQFLYNSLRYYGEPDPVDIDNAHFLLYARPMAEETQQHYTAQQAIEAFKEALHRYGIRCRVELSSKILAGAMVNNVRKTILINKKKTLTPVELNALIHHELGVHMVTTMNAELQPLKVFKLGLPGNTYTQEGLAILSEYLSGNLTFSRLKTLSLRVLAVDMMVKKNSFSHTFQYLIDQHELDREYAFTITARVYRGGGFTKDFVYLRGLRDAYHLYLEKNLDGLFIGKTSFEYLPLINELISRNILKPPKHLPEALNNANTEDPILNYILSSIR